MTTILLMSRLSGDNYNEVKKGKTKMLTIVMSIAIAASPCQCKAVLPWRDHLKSWMMYQKTYTMKSNAKHFRVTKALKKGRGRVA